MYIHSCFSLSLSIYIYIYTCVCVCANLLGSVPSSGRNSPKAIRICSGQTPAHPSWTGRAECSVVLYDHSVILL